MRPFTICAVAAVAVLAENGGIVGWQYRGIMAEERSQQYAVGVDKTAARSGKASGTIRRVAAGEERGGNLAQGIVADQYRGKRVRLSGYVKTERAGSAGLWMRVDNRRPVAFDDCEGRRVEGTKNWTRQEIVLDVPADAVGIALGLNLHGDGQAWIDDVRIEVVGSAVKSTNMEEAIAEVNRANISDETWAKAASLYLGKGTTLLNTDFEN